MTPTPEVPAAPARPWRPPLLAIAFVVIVVVGAGAVLVSILIGDSTGEPEPGEAETAAPAVVAEETAPLEKPHARRAQAGPRDEAPRFPPPSTAGGSPAARPARVGVSARAAKHADGGAAVAGDPDGGSQHDAKAGAEPRRFAEEEPSQSEEERGLHQVDRFLATGGVTLAGRVVEADGGKPVAGTSVHVHHAGMFVEARTDASGAFRIGGMLPRSHVVVWVGRNGDPFVDERIAVTVPEDGQVADAGLVKLLRGDELSSSLPGWVGLFVARRSGQIVVSAVSPWLPADRAGLEVGDQIWSIAGRDGGGLGPRAATFLLRGLVGAPVALVVKTHDRDKRKLALERVRR